MKTLKIPTFAFADPKLAHPDLVPALKLFLEQSQLPYDVFRELLAPGPDRVIYGFQFSVVNHKIRVTRGAAVLGQDVLVVPNDFEPFAQSNVYTAEGVLGGTPIINGAPISRARSAQTMPATYLTVAGQRVGTRPVPLPDPGDAYYPSPPEPFVADLQKMLDLKPARCAHLMLVRYSPNGTLPLKRFISDDLANGPTPKYYDTPGLDFVEPTAGYQAEDVPLDIAWPLTLPHTVSLGLIYYDAAGHVVGWAERLHPISTIQPHRLHAFDHPTGSVSYAHMDKNWVGKHHPKLALAGALKEWYDAAGNTPSLINRLQGVVTQAGGWKLTPNTNSLPPNSIDAGSDAGSELASVVPPEQTLATWAPAHKDPRNAMELHRSSDEILHVTACFKNTSGQLVVNRFNDATQVDTKVYPMDGQPGNGKYSYGQVSRGQVLRPNNRSLWIDDTEIVKAVPSGTGSGTWEYFALTHDQAGSPIIVATRAIEGRTDLTGSWMYWLSGNVWKERQIVGMGALFHVAAKTTASNLFICFDQSSAGQVVAKIPLNNLASGAFTEVSRYDVPAGGSESAASFSLRPDGLENVAMFQAFNSLDMASGQGWLNARAQVALPLSPADSAAPVGPAEFPRCALSTDIDRGAAARAIPGGFHPPGSGGTGGGPGGGPGGDPGDGDPNPAPRPGAPSSLPLPGIPGTDYNLFGQRVDGGGVIVDIGPEPGPHPDPDPDKRWLFFTFGITGETSQVGWISGEGYDDPQSHYSFGLFTVAGRFPSIAISDAWLYIATSTQLRRYQIATLSYPGTLLGGLAGVPPPDLPPDEVPPAVVPRALLQPAPLPQYKLPNNLFNAVWQRVIKKLLKKKAHAAEFPPPAIYTNQGVQLNPKALRASKAFPEVRVGGPIRKKSGEIFGVSQVDADGNESWVVLREGLDAYGNPVAGLVAYEEGQTKTFITPQRWVLTPLQMGSSVGFAIGAYIQVELICEIVEAGLVRVQTRTRNAITPNLQVVNDGTANTPAGTLPTPSETGDIIVFSNVEMFAQCVAIGVKRG